MLFAANWVLLFVFWFYVLKFAKLGRYKLAGSAVTIWVAAYFGLPALGIAGGLYFISFEALLNFALIVAYQAVSRHRNPVPDEVQAEP